MMPLETRLSKDFHHPPSQGAALSGVTAGRVGRPLVLALAALVLAGGCEATDTDARIDQYVADAARTAEQNRDYPGAANFYADLQRSRPDDPSAAVGLARNLRYAGRHEDAGRVAAEALSRFGPLLPLILEKGKAELAGNRAETAVQTLLAGISTDQADWELPATLAVAYDRVGRFDLAADQYQKALAIFPENPDILNNFALSRALSGQLGEALALLRRAEKLPAARPQVRENLQFLEQLQRSQVPLRPGTPLPLKPTELRRLP